ncbi:FAD-dependent monooxygenase [Bradyrhizobium sp. LHD-71]|uniref:FAD-dependent monooxygenase n=1 Tax=Bradyrhizobium sp. LHD-71 TaxID=3072141 RepID=UPI00280D67D8|nr:FAD-dependent monooxygenase [Bradyrhizobium sp. LHD-71]MDQ8731654.1 FAD-dependent monooxygenase [Bradyrhizobium sp. LHD-71]
MAQQPQRDNEGVDVLIVGAGPTGLMLANQLVRRGIKPLVIDRHSGPAQQTRAMAVQARTLEIYAHMGIIDEALSLGAIAAAFDVWADGQWRARIPFGDIGQDLSPFPFVLMLGQDDNERIMGASLGRQGVAIAWNTELTALEQKPAQVEATLKQADGSMRTVNAKWLAGCDGAHSAVRELNGIGFPGAPYEHTFFVADTTATGSMKPGELNVYLWKDGFHLFFPMRGQDHWRVIGILPEQLRQRDDVDFDEIAPAIQRETASDLSFQDCSWFSTYRIHHRAAERFRDQRCFLLGDAAHIHSPAGGQGMNTGLQDAYNLAWKLALVVQGRADDRLLDSYEQERVPVAKRLLQTTDQAFQLIVSDSWLASLFRTKLIARVAAAAMNFRSVRRFAFRTVSQIGIRYPQSALTKVATGMPEDAPAPGDRFPWLKLALNDNDGARDLYQALDDRRFNLLVFGQSPSGLQDSFDDLVTVHRVPESKANDAELTHARIPSPSFYLLRPDGHVGLAGPGFDGQAVSRYLSENVHLKAQVVAG